MRARALATAAITLSALLALPGSALAGTTPPTVTASVTPTPNGADWNNTLPVTVSFSCTDDESGVASCDPDVVLNTEGADQLVTGNGTDNNGNLGSTSVTVHIDTTDPSIVGTAAALPPGSSWYLDDVPVSWDCTDALSGIAVCPPPSVVTGEGAALSAAGTAFDVAGNDATATVNDIAIDRTAPVTTSDAPTGYTNGAVAVTLTPSDNLSGVADTLYTLDGGPETSGTTVLVAGEGTHTLTFHSVDVAGNVEEPVTVEILIDETAPSISHDVSPAPNGAGWNSSDTTVTFECTDALSGIASCTAPTTLTADGAGQEVNGSAEDNAGNTAVDNAVVHLDATAPTIDGSASPDANAAGWRDGPVTVSFSCNDATSGVASCPAPVTLDADGADQAVPGTAFDTAGNDASTVVGGIDIDQTDPEISGTILETPNENGWYAGSVTVRWTCTDALSGIAVCPADSVVTTDGPDQSVSAVAFDIAGNSALGTVGGINIDGNRPEVTASRDRQPNAYGWNRTDVTVTWECSDDMPGAELSEASFTFTGEGRNLSHTVTCTDIAGNVIENTQYVSIDRTSPLTTIDQYTGGDLRGGATDNLSGVLDTRSRWAIAGSFEKPTVCVAGCRTAAARWRVSPPQPRPNVYRVAAWSTDLAGNIGPSDTDTIVAAPYL